MFINGEHVTRRELRERAGELGLTLRHMERLARAGSVPLRASGGAGTPARSRGPAPTAAAEWVRWLSGAFPRGVYFTGTYNDHYGHAHSLMTPRAVHADVMRFFREMGERPRYVCAVERHKHRDILHWHGILDLPNDEQGLHRLRVFWTVHRGFCKALPMQDGAVSYVLKYALKEGADSSLWWNL